MTHSRAFRAQLALLAAILVSTVHALDAGAAPRFGTRWSGQIANASPGMFAVGIAIGDLDGDGNLDVLAPGANSGMAVLLGRGDGTLVPPIAVGPGDGVIAWMALADFDGDGNLDIGEATYSEAAVYY